MPSPARSGRAGRSRAPATVAAVLILALAFVTAGLSPAVPAGPARADAGQVCRVALTVTTDSEDGLRDDSTETVTLGGAALLFEDWNGDGRDDTPPQPFHRGGTGDRANATFVWNAHLSPCVPSSSLLDGFTFTHSSTAPDIRADNWDLAGLQITDRDTGFVYFRHDTSEGLIHRFLKNSDQTWNTTAGRPDPDTDGDGLSDRIELLGIPRGDGTRDTWLPEHGADPCRKTIAVEIDWLDDGTTSDRPSPLALDEARHMFDAAPVGAAASCPYGPTPGPGMQLLVDVSNAITVTPAERVRPLRDKGPDGVTNFDRYWAVNFPAHRRDLFFYNIWGYKHDNSTSSGFSPVEGHKTDFIVSLGSWSGASVRQQSGTFVHELGHALGLLHGGDGDLNYKPNYLSVMNYRYQVTGVPDYSAWSVAVGGMLSSDQDAVLDGRTVESVSSIDYSRRKLDDLVQNRLVESKGVGGDTDLLVAWRDRNLVLRAGPADRGLDWNWSAWGYADPDPSREVSLNLMAWTQVCVSPVDPAGASGGLDTTRAPGDVRFGDQILTGPDNECSTPAASTDTQVKPVGFRYEPLAALAGFDDWKGIRFPVGPGAGGAAPGSPEPDVTKEEAARETRDLLDAMVAAATPAPAASPRWGYAYMDQATAPLDVPAGLNPAYQWTTGRLDPATAAHRATVTHTGTGSYEVRLPDVASATGIAHVTPYRTVYRGRTCRVTGYEASGPDEVIRVQCFDHTGAPVDWWFEAFFAAPAADAAPYATVRYNPPGGTATLAPVLNSGTHNSAGRANRVYHEGTGRYRVVLEGAAYTSDKGYTQVTPYGAGTAARCHPEGTKVVDAGLEVTVGCYAVAQDATPRPVDAPWLLSYVEGAGLHHDASVPAAYVTTTGDPAAPSVDVRHSYSGDGETPSVTRLSTGWYRVTYTGGIGKAGDTVQVSTLTPGRYCHLGNINSTNPPQLTIDVYCHSGTGMLADGNFGAAYLRAP
ncbi:hypothetical protein [Sphaerisporangium fuscum]|uniref:hypothetical protein n=1 Tax=Sphaerisporangium fuscum TaxID=2835868 RepID=UPI001BDCAABD|nr:hypothetical protein [Sphaerisporangium fuscum]